MSRITKWKFEKTKVKVVFRLQFHATHIPQTGWDKLFISFIPAESGKATAKTTKANVRNGTCKWADPIYETTRFLQDLRSKQYDEKLYKLVVAMGSSRASILGEATINLTDYADALKPSTVALPLHGCNSGTTLHVTVQLLTSKTGFREFEQQRELRERGLQTGADNKHDYHGPGKIPVPEESANHVDMVDDRFKFRQDAKDLSSHEEVGQSEEYTESAVGLDDSSNNSESLYEEKHDSSSAHEADSVKSIISGDMNGLPLDQNLQAEKGNSSSNQIMARGSSDSIHGWGSDYSFDNNLAAAYDENIKLRASLEMAESSMLELKLELSALQSQANDIGIGAQKFSHLLAAEISSSEDLVKEVSVLKSECSKLKEHTERLKHLKFTAQSTVQSVCHSESEQILQDIQLKWIKGILVVEERIRELQNKTYLGLHERDATVLHSDLGALLDLLRDIKYATGKATSLLMGQLEESDLTPVREFCLRQSKQPVLESVIGMDLCPPETLLHHFSRPSLVSQESDSKGVIEAMEGKMFDLIRELDEAKVERQSLVRKMDEMECYYEALVHQLEENQKQMLGELQIVRNEHSACLYTISANKAETELLRQDMNEQILQLANEIRDMDALNKELERRASISEAALRRARLNYSIAVDKLQKDLSLLSSQVVSLFETNENLIKQAFSEPPLPCFPECENTSKTLQDFNAANTLQSQSQNPGLTRQSLGRDIHLEELKRSLYLQEELYGKVEEELSQMHSINTYLEILSTALQQSLVEAIAGIKLVKEKMDELALQLDGSNDSKDQLMIKLQTAMNDIDSLNEENVGCVAKYNDMVTQNQVLAKKLESISNEKSTFAQKIADLEALVAENSSYRGEYEACMTENTELSVLLEQKNCESEKLKCELHLLEGELKTLEVKFYESIALKENLEEKVSFVQDRLFNLLSSYEKQINYSCQANMERDNLSSLISKLEEIQQNACDKILQLTKGKNELENEKAIAQLSLNSARSEILHMKESFKNEIQTMVTKLDLSNVLAGKLQYEFESVANKLQLSSEVVERNEQENKELLADLARLELELQDLASRNGFLAEEMLGLDTLAEEYGRSNSIVAELMQEKQDLLVSLNDKREECAKLLSENSCLKDDTRSLHDQLHIERVLKDRLEGTVRDLTSLLDTKQSELLKFDQLKLELLQSRELVSKLESENSKLSNLLLQRDQNFQKEVACLRNDESQFLEMHECVIAADVKLICVVNQYESKIQDFLMQLESSAGCIKEYQRKFHEAEGTLNHTLEENANFVMRFESLTSDLVATVSQNQALSEANQVLTAQLAEYKKKLSSLEDNFYMHKCQNALDAEQLKDKLAIAEEEMDSLIVSNEALQISVLVLKVKLDEQQAIDAILKDYEDELTTSHARCHELTQKLSEQVLKTEEFKNLSIHFKELKDKADADARDRKETEAQAVAPQESLRIAFIKEQYETKIQELRQQLSISKKHGEEMLLRLQDAVDEVEDRKRSEAVHLKRNEEMSLKLLALEAELQAILSDKREKINACECLKTELECAVLSLECCKEEKEKVEASLRECDGEKSRIAAEFVMLKKQLERFSSVTNEWKEENGGINRTKCETDESTGSFSPYFLPKDKLTPSNLEDSDMAISEQAIQDSAADRISMHACLGEDLQLSNGRNLDAANDHLGTQSMRSSLEHLHEELERLKNENSLIISRDQYCDENFQDLQKELKQLHKVNSDLASIFPTFSESSSNGNALERVLALEIELAEALRSKNKSNILFQSSFLKQHSDQEAVLKSFRDINELIKEMLELKGRYVGVETELKEMHDRYSQLSLQFAEVEGERQKLKMTLKSVRASKKNTNLNRTSSATIADA